MKVPSKIAAGEIVLRPHIIEDLPDFQRFLADAQSTRYMAFTPEQKTPEAAKAMLETVIDSYTGDTPVFSLTIAHADDNAYLGSAGAAPAEGDAMEVFVTLMPEARGKGYAAAAMKALADYIFNTSSVEQLIADVVKENTASIKLFESLGYLCTGPVERAAEEGQTGYREMTGLRYILGYRK